MAVSVTYNGFNLPNVYGPFNFQQSYDRAVFSCNFLIKGVSKADLVGLCNTAESKLREPYENLTLNFGGTAEYSFNHDDNTGLLTSPEISKIPNPLSTATSRAYTFKFSCQLQADKAGFNFRRSASFKIVEGPNKGRQLTFNVEYTASESPDQTSSQNFASHAENYANTIISTLGGKGFNLVNKTETTEHEKKITNGILVYQEILDDEEDGTSNNLSILNAQTQYSVDLGQEIGIATSGVPYTAIPITTVNVTYSADIDSTLQTPTNIDDLYVDTIRPWIIKHSFDVLGLDRFQQAGNTYIIQREKYDINSTAFKVQGSMTFSVPETLSSLISLRESITNDINQGIVYRKIWDGLPDTYAFWRLGSIRIVNRMIETAKLAGPVIDPPELGGSFLKLSQKRTDEVKEIGTGSPDFSGDTQKVEIYTSNFQESYLFVRNLT